MLKLREIRQRVAESGSNKGMNIVILIFTGILEAGGRMATFKRATGIASLSEKAVSVVLTEEEYIAFCKANGMTPGQEAKATGKTFDKLALNMEVAMNGAEETPNGEPIIPGSRGWFVPTDNEGNEVPGVVIRMNIVSSDSPTAGKNTVYDGGEGNNVTVQRTASSVQQTTARNNPAATEDVEDYSEAGFNAMTLKQLREVAEKEGIDHEGLKKAELVASLTAELV